MSYHETVRRIPRQLLAGDSVWFAWRQDPLAAAGVARPSGSSHRIVDRRPSDSASGVSFRIEPAAAGFSTSDWWDAQWLTHRLWSDR